MSRKTKILHTWICDPNYHKIQWTFAFIFSKNYQCFEKPYQTPERVLHYISKHFEVLCHFTHDKQTNAWNLLGKHASNSTLTEMVNYRLQKVSPNNNFEKFNVTQRVGIQT